MPTATPPPPAARKPARKRPPNRRGKARAPARELGARTQRQSRRRRRAAARTRAANQAEASVRQAETATRETAGVFGDYAERAVLIPVGAALIARDRVVSSVNDTISSYPRPTKAQAQLRRFERRGVTARNRRRARGPQNARARRARTAPAPPRDREDRERPRRAARRRRQERSPSSPTAFRSASSASSETTSFPRPGPERPGTARGGRGRVCRPHIPPAVVAPSPPSTRGAAPTAPRVFFCRAPSARRRRRPQRLSEWRAMPDTR